MRRREEGLLAIAGPDALFLATPVELVGRDFHTVAEFDVSEGDRVPFVLTDGAGTSAPRPRSRRSRKETP